MTLRLDNGVSFPSGDARYLKLNQTTPQTTTGSFIFPIVGVGMTPVKELDVNGSMKATGDLTILGYAGIGTAPSVDYGINLSKTFTTVTGLNHGGTKNLSIYNPVSSSGDFNIALSNYASKTGAEAMTGQYGAGGLVGIFNNAVNNGAGTVSWAYGSIQTVQSLQGGAITNAISLLIPNGYTLNGGTIVNQYGIYIDNQTVGGTKNFAIYADGGMNYFGGQTGFRGATTPAASVHIGAGSASAGTTPIKLTSGTLNTVAVDGAIEYLSNYFEMRNDGLKLGKRLGVGGGGVASGVLQIFRDSTNPMIYMSTDFANGNNFSISPFISGVSNGGLQIKDETNAVVRMAIQYSTGKVGINTSSPSGMLHINGLSQSTDYGVKLQGATYNPLFFYSDDASANSRNWGMSANRTFYGNFEIFHSTANGGNPWNAGVTRIAITQAGNVGMGTVTPATKLDVAGSMQVSSAVALSLGGYVRTFAEATGTPSGTTTYFDIAVAVPTLTRLLGCQLRVDTALTAGETWKADYNGGSAEVIATPGTAVAKNTKVSTLYAKIELTTNTVNVRITRDAGNFTNATGVIRAIVYYETFTAMGNAA
jgi:hypothetical protein